LKLAPTQKPIGKSLLLPNWFKDHVNATLFLSTMSRPRHGKLRLDSTDTWIFTPGNVTGLAQGIILKDLSANAQHLLNTGQLFKGHTKFCRVYTARNQAQLRDGVLRHVSAHGLTSLIAPATLSSHHQMTENDKNIWDAAYSEEYDGLSELPTWEILTEDQFKQLSKGTKALPSMAIATIKYDAFNRPKCAKYRIVILGNHDYHTWFKEVTAVPVMSQLELRFLTALAISQKRILKTAILNRRSFNLLFLNMNITLFVHQKVALDLLQEPIGILFGVCMVYTVPLSYGMTSYHLFFDLWVLDNLLHLHVSSLVI
jgi:hypothetical protein